MNDKPFRQERIDQAIEQFRAAELTPAEAMLAAAQLLHSSLKSFRDDATRFRAVLGDTVTHAFARQELNDMIYELQDALPPIIRTYNSLLRDPDQKNDAPPG
jgi:hypothetical protein